MHSWLKKNYDRLLTIPFLRDHIGQFARFAMVGGSAALIDLVSTTVQVELLFIPPHIAYLPSTALAVIFVFLANKFFTFRSHSHRVGDQMIRFAMVYGTAIISNLGISWTLLWLGVHYLIARCIAIGIGMLWNYCMSHYFVFRKGEDEVVVV